MDLVAMLITSCENAFVYMVDDTHYSLWSSVVHGTKFIFFYCCDHEFCVGVLTVD